MSSPSPSSTARGTIAIVLADDHRMVRSALRALLEAHEDFAIVGEAGDARSALEQVLELRPDVLVLDLTMPGDLAPLDCIRLVRKLSPDTAVVVLTMHTDPAFVRRALRLGALAYVPKECADEELVEAVRSAARGEIHVASSLAAAPEPAAGAEALTPREAEVLRLIALGHTNSEIAARLALSVRTVESHRARVQRKLGRSRRADLVRYAFDHHLLDASGTAGFC